MHSSNFHINLFPTDVKNNNVCVLQYVRHYSNNMLTRLLCTSAKSFVRFWFNCFFTACSPPFRANRTLSTNTNDSDYKVICIPHAPPRQHRGSYEATSIVPLQLFFVWNYRSNFSWIMESEPSGTFDGGGRSCCSATGNNNGNKLSDKIIMKHWLPVAQFKSNFYNIIFSTTLLCERSLWRGTTVSQPRELVPCNSVFTCFWAMLWHIQATQITKWKQQTNNDE